MKRFLVTLFEGGDVVQLKSGGPRMTVLRADAVTATVFNATPSGEICRQEIPASCLDLADGDGGDQEHSPAPS